MQHKVAVIRSLGKTSSEIFSNCAEPYDPDPDIATRMAEQYKVAMPDLRRFAKMTKLAGLSSRRGRRCMRRCLCRHSQRVSIFLLKNLWQ